jgi:hypothetical protein
VGRHVHDHGADAGDLAFVRADGVVAREPVTAVSQPHRFLVRRLVVDHRLAGLQDLPVERLEVSSELGLHVGESLARVLRRGEAVDLGESVVDADEAELAIPEADPNRRRDEQRVEQRIRRLDGGVEPGVLDAERDPAGDLLGEDDVVGRVAPARLARSERERAERAATGDQRDDHVRGRLQAVVEVEVAIISRGRRELGLVRSLDQQRLSAREHARGRVLRVPIRRVAAPDLAQQLLFGGVDVVQHRLPQRLALLDQVDDAVVGHRRDDHVAEPCQGELEVERRREQGARLAEEANTLVRAPSLGDVVEAVDRELDLAVLVEDRCRAYDRPALLTRRPDPVADGPLRRATVAERHAAGKLIERKRTPLLVEKLEPCQHLRDGRGQELRSGGEAYELRRSVVRVHEPAVDILRGDPVGDGAEDGLQLGSRLRKLLLRPLPLGRRCDVARDRLHEL